MLIVRMFLLVLALFPLTTNLEAGFWDNLRGMIWKSHTKAPPLIDVLIVNDRPGVMLEVTGTYQIIDPNTKQFIGKRHLGKKRYFQSQPAGLKWGEEFPGVYQLELIPDDLSVTTIIDGVEYRGVMFIYDIGGAISIVNRVPIEEYLLSTLPQKYMEEPLPEEALSAIAITARTDALYQSQHPKNKYWAIDSNTEGYRGVNSQVPENQMDHAIRATRHMVLSKTGSYEGVVTPFHATWGAQTGGHHSQQGGQSFITTQQAEEMAKQGQHAAQILSKAFPGSHIEIIY